MPATLDPATALVLIDLQHGITALPTAHPSDFVRVKKLLRLRPGKILGCHGGPAAAVHDS